MVSRKPRIMKGERRRREREQWREGCGRIDRLGGDRGLARLRRGGPCVVGSRRSSSLGI